MLQSVQVLLEETLVERAVRVGTQLYELVNEEYGVTIFIFADAVVLIATEQLNNRFEEVRSDVADGLR